MCGDDKDLGGVGALPASQDRATAVEPVPVSPLRDGIPSAITLNYEQLREIFRAGEKFGSDCATAFEWGSGFYLKLDDELGDALCEILNEGKDWGGPEYIEYDVARQWAREQAQAIEARRAETQSGSVHESAVRNADAPTPLGQDSNHD